MDYNRECHSKHCLICHLIFVCKYRKPLLTKLGDTIKTILNDISEEIDVEILEMEVDKDYIHILIQYSPIKSVLEIVRSFKQTSTYRIWRLDECKSYLRKNYWKEHIFWSDGYFACSIGQVSEQTIRAYIQNQG